MTLATVFARAQNGLTADLVTVEVHLAPGLPGLKIVGPIKLIFGLCCVLTYQKAGPASAALLGGTDTFIGPVE